MGAKHSDSTETAFDSPREEPATRIITAVANLLAVPENDDFAAELDSRLTCALVEAGKYNDAIALFQGLFKRDELDDKQRLQLYFGLAHLRTGNLSEARSHLFEAMSGSDPNLAQSVSISADPRLVHG